MEGRDAQQPRKAPGSAPPALPLLSATPVPKDGQPRSSPSQGWEEHCRQRPLKAEQQSPSSQLNQEPDSVPSRPPREVGGGTCSWGQVSKVPCLPTARGSKAGSGRAPDAGQVHKEAPCRLAATPASGMPRIQEGAQIKLSQITPCPLPAHRLCSLTPHSTYQHPDIRGALITYLLPAYTTHTSQCHLTRAGAWPVCLADC